VVEFHVLEAFQVIMLVTVFATRDRKVQSAIDRYARDSLMMIYMERREQGSQLQLLVERNILTLEEAELLEPQELPGPWPEGRGDPPGRPGPCQGSTWCPARPL